MLRSSGRSHSLLSVHVVLRCRACTCFNSQADVFTSTGRRPPGRRALVDAPWSLLLSSDWLRAELREERRRSAGRHQGTRKRSNVGASRQRRGRARPAAAAAASSVRNGSGDSYRESSGGGEAEGGRLTPPLSRQQGAAVGSS